MKKKLTDIQMSTAKLLGRTTASTGSVEEIGVGGGLSLSSGALSVDSYTVSGSEIIVSKSIVPATDNTLSLGSATKKWADIFVSANTIHLGDATQLSGTSIIVDAGGSANNLASIPTVQASKIVAKPYTYNPGGGPITVRPSIEFQVGLNSYPISLNTETFEFSLDAEGNYGTGSLVAKKITLTNGTSTALSLTGNITQDGNFTSTQTDHLFRWDGNATLGFDNTSTLTVKSNTTFQGTINTQGATNLGDGNDAVAVNAGTNNFTVAASNFSVAANGNVTVAGNLTVSGGITSIVSNEVNIGDALILLNSDIGGGTAPTENAGIQVARGSSAAANWIWDEATDSWGPAGGDIKNVGNLVATAISGSLTGNASTATALANSRDFAISGGGITASAQGFTGSANVTLSASVDAGHITLTRMASLAANSFIGNNTGSPATPLALGATDATAMLNTFTASAKGLVPPPTTATGRYLSDNGTWVAVDLSTRLALAGGTMTGKLNAAAPTASSAMLNVGYGTAPSTINQVDGDIWSTSSGLFFRTASTQFQVATMSNLSGYALLTGATFSGAITASNLSGTNTGDQTITLSGGDVTTGAMTGGSYVASIGANKVTNAMLAQVATATFKGRTTAATGNVEDLTATQATALLDVATQALKGLLSAADKTKLDGVATGATANNGTVTGVTLTQPAAGLTITNSGTNQTTAVSGTFALANDLAAVEGLTGTGIVRRTADDTWSTGTGVSLSEMANLAANSIIGNNTGVGATPIALTTTQARTLLSINNVDNTSDANKPVSTAQQTALDLKANLAGAAFSGAGASVSVNTTDSDYAFSVLRAGVVKGYFGGANLENKLRISHDGINYFGVSASGADWNGNAVYHVGNKPTKADVGLGNVDNTSDANKPVSTAQQSALDLKANLASPTFTGTVTAATISATGNITGANLSGTNTGDQTITLTGDVTGGGTGSFATTIGANRVTNAMLAQVPTATFHGRTTAATGNVENLTATQATALLDLVVAAGAKGLMSGSDKTKLDGIATGATANATDASLRDRSTHTGTQAPSTIATAAGSVLVGRYAATAGAGQEITIGTGLALNTTTGVLSATDAGGTVTSVTLTQPAAGLTITNSGTSQTTAASGTFALANDLAAVEGLTGTGIVRRTAADTWSAGTAVALTEVATQAANTFVANATAGVAAPTAITGTTATSLLDVFTTSLKGLAPASGGGTTNFLRADGTWAAPAGGSGTVTSVSVVSANGVAGSVTNASTTPAITLSLGAITPSSVTSSGLVKTVGLLDSGGVMGRFEGTGAAAPAGATGNGTEIFAGVIQSYNRTSSAYTTLSVDGLSIALRPSGSTVANITSTGVAVTGTLSATGQISSSAEGAFKGAAANYPYIEFLKNGIGTWYVGGLGTTSNNFGIRLNALAPVLETDGATTTIRSGASTITSTSATGLTVTGALLATGSISVGAGGIGATVEHVTIDGGSGTNGGGYLRFNRNGGVTGYLGNESAVLGGASDALILYSISGASVRAATGSTVKHVVNTTTITETSSTGLAVTGTLSTTGKAAVGGAIDADAALRVDQSNPTRGVINIVRNSGAAGQTGAQIQVSQNGIADWAFGQPAATNAFAFWAGRSAGVDGTEVMRLTSGGVAVTGALSATGNIAAGDRLKTSQGSFVNPGAGEAQLSSTTASGAILAGSGTSTDVVITNKTGGTVMSIATGTTTAAFAGNVTTSGNVSVANSAPIITLQDTDSTGVGVIGYISWKNSAGTEVGYLGQGTATDTDMTFLSATDAVIAAVGGERARATGTGFAVTGTLSSTGAGTIGGTLSVTGTGGFNIGTLGGSPRLDYASSAFNFLTGAGAGAAVTVGTLAASSTITAVGATIGSGGTANVQTNLYINATSNSLNGGALVFQRNGGNSVFIGDHAAATGSGTGAAYWTYGANPHVFYSNGVKVFEVPSTGSGVFAGDVSLNNSLIFASSTTAGTGVRQVNIPHTGDNLVFGRTGPTFVTQFGWRDADRNHIYSATEFRIGNSSGYVSFSGSSATVGGNTVYHTGNLSPVSLSANNTFTGSNTFNTGTNTFNTQVSAVAGITSAGGYELTGSTSTGFTFSSTGGDKGMALSGGSLWVDTGGAVGYLGFGGAARLMWDTNGCQATGTLSSSNYGYFGISQTTAQVYLGGSTATNSEVKFRYAGNGSERNLNCASNGVLTWAGSTVYHSGNLSPLILDPAGAAQNVNGPIRTDYHFGRYSGHQHGGLVGGYNNIGASEGYSSPIYCIGTSYLPAATTLGTMYGIGFSTGAITGMSGVAAGSWGMYAASAGTARIFLDAGSGHVHGTGNMYAVDFFASSDIALKTNISTIGNSLALVEQMRGVRYTLRETGAEKVGVIAQEMESVLPEVVEGEEGEKRVSYSNLTAVLIEAVKEMSSEIKALKARIADLEVK